MQMSLGYWRKKTSSPLLVAAAVLHTSVEVTGRWFWIMR